MAFTPAAGANLVATVLNVCVSATFLLLLTQAGGIVLPLVRQIVALMSLVDMNMTEMSE